MIAETTTVATMSTKASTGTVDKIPITPLPKGTKITTELKRRICQHVVTRYTEDTATSVRSLAAEIGRSYGMVHEILRQKRVLRPRGGARRLS